MSLALSRFLSDGMVVRREHVVPVWGTGEPGREVWAWMSMCAESGAPLPGRADTVIGPDGRFEMELPGLPAGGPYTLHVADSEGERIAVKDILSGALWFVSGQSNIDVTMERCADSYPEILRGCADDGLRTFHVEANADYHGPLSEPLTGSWKKAQMNHILEFSATGYFFARYLREMTGMPVGFIQASLGGSRITSWMSRRMLAGDPAYEPLLHEAELYAQDTYLEEVNRRNETGTQAWQEALAAADRGLSAHWEMPEAWTGENNDSGGPCSSPHMAPGAAEGSPLRAGAPAASGEFREFREGEARPDAGRITLPCFFRDTQLSGFSGAVWLERYFAVPCEMAGKSAGLWLGTMVDADTVWVNGVKVGETGYSYPPRKYRIPEGVLRTGGNAIVIRLTVESGEGRVTPGKSYMIYNDQGVLDLRGTWNFRIGAACGPRPAWDQVNWKATGLFNGTAAPCFHMPVDGIVWYQGEANTHEPYDYLDLTRRYVEGYRELWGEDVPYLYTQLPNFDIDLTEEEQWPSLRERQRQVLQAVPGTGMAVTMDLGEDNDLHPHGKKEIGHRLALWAAHMVYGLDVEYTGPVPIRAVLTSRGSAGAAVRVELTHAEGLYADSTDKGAVIRDCELVDADGAIFPAEAVVKDSALIVVSESMTTRPVRVRYAYHNVMHGALVYNSAGLPMSPFVLDVE